MTPGQTKKLCKLVGAWVLRQREKLGLKQGEFSDLIGRSESALRGYETGRHDMPLSVIFKIAYEADCTIEETQELFEAYAALQAPGQDGTMCTKCDEVKPEEEFPLKGGGRPGRRSVCRQCVNAYSAEWKKKNKKAAPQVKAAAKAQPERKRHFPPFKGYAA